MRSETTSAHSLAARCSNATVHGLSFLSALDCYVSRNVGVILCLGLIISLGNALVLSRLKPLFMDEMLTWTEAQSSSLSALLSGLIRAPVTVDPPLYPIIAFFALRLPLRADLALRLPSFICYSGMMLSLFIIMRRRACPSVALIACFVPMILPAHDYALQARPYALLLGLCGWAFALWQRAADNRRRRTISLLLLFLCLTFAVWTHYLALLIFIPLCVGELWRTAVSGFDRAMWFTLLTPVAAVLAYIPFLSAASAYRAVPFHGVMVYEMFDTYSFVLSARLFAVLLLCCLAALALPAIYGRLLASSDEEVTFRAHEYVSIATLFLFPFFVFGSAKLLTHSYVPRYALPFTVAAALLIAASFGILARPVKGLGPLAMVLILLQAALPLRTFVHGLPPPADLIDGSSTEPFDHFPDLLIAMPRTDDYLRFRIFGPNRIRRRMFLVSFSPDEVRRVVNPVVAQELPTVDLMNAALHRTIDAPVQDFQDFIDAHPRFLLMNTLGREEVLNKSRQLCWIGQSKGQDIYLVQRPGQ